MDSHRGAATSLSRKTLEVSNPSRLASWILALTVALAVTQPTAAQNETALWEALRSGGHVALLRHAVAPGTGDSPEFAIGDCTTQRVLSDEGRGQAGRIGARFRANGIERAQVLSSQWCRCMETARLLRLGPVQEFAAINSFFRDYERREPQTRQLRQWIAMQDLREPVVLVTHQVNITALTNVYPRSGELVIVRRDNVGGITVIGTIQTD